MKDGSRMKYNTNILMLLIFFCVCFKRRVEVYFFIYPRQFEEYISRDHEPYYLKKVSKSTS